MPDDPAIAEAIQNIRNLREAGVTALSSRSDERALTYCRRAYAGTRDLIRATRVSEPVEESISGLVDDPGATPAAGVGVLGKVDLTRINSRDLELGLALSLGFSAADFERYFRAARSALRRAQRANAAIDVHHTEVLVGLLNSSESRLLAERDRRRRRATPGPRARRQIIERRLCRESEDVIFGSIFATGIIVANAAYAPLHFRRSYFIGSGLAVSLSY